MLDKDGNLLNDEGDIVKTAEELAGEGASADGDDRQKIPSDDDLDAAYDAAMSEDADDIIDPDGAGDDDDLVPDDGGEVDGDKEDDGDDPEGEPEPDEDSAKKPKENSEIHAVRSELGRVRKQLDQLSGILGNQNLQAILNGDGKRDASDEDGGDEYFDVPETKSDFDKLVNERVKQTLADIENERTTKEANYKNEYLNTLVDELDSLKLDEDAQEEVIAEMRANFTQSHGLGASGDVKMNIQKARYAIMERKLSGKNDDREVPGRGAGRKAQHGGKPSSGGKEPKKSDTIKLDPEAEKFIAESGMTPEQAKEILAKPTPAHLARR